MRVPTSPANPTADTRRTGSPSSMEHAEPTTVGVTSAIAPAEEDYAVHSAAARTRKGPNLVFLAAPAIQALGPLAVMPLQIHILGTEWFGLVAVAQAWMVTF